MSRVTMIQHINIQISDREQTREWYEKVLGAEYLDRGPELNKGQLQLRLGSGEIHSTHGRETDIGKLRIAAMKEGMKTLRLSGAQKVSSGETTVAEVLRVAPFSGFE